MSKFACFEDVWLLDWYSDVVGQLRLKLPYFYRNKKMLKIWHCQEQSSLAYEILSALSLCAIRISITCENLVCRNSSLFLHKNMLWVLIRIASAMILMSTHRKSFYGELTKIILQLSWNTLLICSSVYDACEIRWGSHWTLIGLVDSATLLGKTGRFPILGVSVVKMPKL